MMSEVERGIADLLALYEKTHAENERLRAALSPFATSLRLARAAFDGPADRGHLEAVAATYIRCNDLMEAEAILAAK